jgi:hypothetical protein
MAAGEFTVFLIDDDPGVLRSLEKLQLARPQTDGSGLAGTLRSFLIWITGISHLLIFKRLRPWRLGAAYFPTY